MKIGDTSSIEPAGLTARVVADRVAARPVRPAAPERVDRADRIELSHVARTLGQLVGRVADTTPDPARAAQLEILRNAVASGRYQPDLEAVARKFLVDLAAEPRR